MGWAWLIIKWIGVVLVAIWILDLAFNSFPEAVQKARRAEGKLALLLSAKLQERHHGDAGIYVQDIAALHGKPAGSAIYSGEDNVTNPKSAYRIVVEPATAECPLSRCFRLTATPTSDFKDPDCGPYTLTSTGERSGVNKHKDEWWRVSKDVCQW